MDLNTAADILMAHRSEVLFDIEDLTVHQLDDERILIVKSEHCFLIERESDKTQLRYSSKTI
ncbi:hypothetical protein VCRA2123O443_200065 [Vibrio crassostreae]|uniref:hypothetical protein n=1 Tax=Vibrio crassostreae TaxID=246167 RepID=UPI000F474AE2|nr:hypothetical protein [Vibrio crassostreae]ROR07982.1 hypothetical protein EDB36_11661 [Vibrio crassostreae]CAK1907101.1 hypothetical protein VCRA2110O182_200028 [Vibrio crassostreae]CAK2306111.1 hypothetical protein VCRA2111O408_200067 [Vibrio crassostreae]CAK2322079.1 hypothetical protein VCRA211O406_200028 [Vibrio crassostreae]CAK3226093.1 hypothetical protein VCRA2123O443_200065 [Vibrio crassostreae]